MLRKDHPTHPSSQITSLKTNVELVYLHQKAPKRPKPRVSQSQDAAILRKTPAKMHTQIHPSINENKQTKTLPKCVLSLV